MATCNIQSIYEICFSLLLKKALCDYQMAQIDRKPKPEIIAVRERLQKLNADAIAKVEA